MIMTPRLVILSVCVAFFSVIAGCSPTSSQEDVLDVVQPERIPERGEYNEKDMNKFSHLTISNTVGDVVDNPAFKGFGRYILPLEWRYDPEMKLSEIPSLLPYHNYVDAGRAVGYINDMIDMVNRGDRLYYDLGRKDAGLFFFPGKPGAPFAVICPGGGFSYVGSIHEGFPIALELSKVGYNAFVIQYSVDRGAQSAVEDLSAGIDYIFRHASELDVSTDDYSVWGGSAGARMAAYMGSYTPAAFGDFVEARPATVVMGYTGHSDYTRQDPPTYVVIGENDGIASPAVMRRRVEALQSLGIDAEFHLFPNLRHGFGLGIGTSADGWVDNAAKFWEKHIERSAGIDNVTM